MQFFLANSAWLWLVALGAVPVLVHLFARSNPQRYQFSNTEFLRRILKKTARMRKPQDWIILLLRTLAVLALLFAFLQPLLTGGNDLQTGRKTTVFIIDRSASMAAKNGQTDRFSLACQKAGELLKSGSSDEANIIWMDSLPDGAFPQPGPNLDYLNELLSKAEVSDEASSPAPAIRTAISQLELVKGSREIVIISDFQNSEWQDFKIETPKGIDLVKVQVGDSTSENLTIHSLFPSPADPVIGQKVNLIARIKNYSPAPRRTTLFLESGGSRQSRDVNIPAWGEAETTFQTSFSEAGLVPVTARIDGDDFPGDNSRHTVIKVRDSLRLVSLAPKDSPEAGVLARFADSLDWLEHRTATEVAPGTCDFLFVHRWDGKTSFKEHSTKGTTIFAQPTVGLSHQSLNQFLGTSIANPETLLKPGKNEEGWKAGISSKADPDTPAFLLFQSGEFGNPAAGIFKSRFALPQIENARRFLDYQDNTPALVASFTKPHFFWNLPLDPAESNWSAQSPFVPFLAELLLSARPTHSGDPLEVLPGSALSWVPGDELSPDSLSLENPKGEIIETKTVMTSAGPRLLSVSPSTPGLYHWKMSNGIVHQQAVNFPSSESDLRLANPDRIEGGEVVDPQALLRRAALGDGIPLWHWLVAAALLFLLLESLVSLWKPKPSEKGGAIA